MRYYSFRKAMWRNIAYGGRKRLSERIKLTETHTFEEAFLLCDPAEKYALQKDFCMLELVIHMAKKRKIRNLQRSEITKLSIRKNIPPEVTKQIINFSIY